MTSPMKALEEVQMTTLTSRVPSPVLVGTESQKDELKGQYEDLVEIINLLMKVPFLFGTLACVTSAGAIRNGCASRWQTASR